MRDKAELLNMGKSTMVSQSRALTERGADAPQINNEGELVSENVWTWVLKTLKASWSQLFEPYPTYDQPSNNGIFQIQKDAESPVEIALLSDWASNTKEANHIAKQAGIRDYSIHLGDTYFVGDDDEIKASFFEQEGGTWPYGKLGSFAMLGNHEMYSGGNSYFKDLLPRMGNYNSAGNQVQEASFFCLENKYWRIIGLDTGYDSLLPPHRFAPNKNLKLTPQQISWLHDTVKLNDDKRGLIFLSHHQAFSAFEDEFPNPLETISTLMNPGRDIIWLWGHEHWMSVYGPNQMHNGARVFARCIGNSGMPVELDVDGGVKRPKSNFPHAAENKNLVLFDQRQKEIIGNNVRLGHNGYVILTLQGNKLAINYYDDNFGKDTGRLVLEEHWTIDNQTGKLSGVSIADRSIILGDMNLMDQLSWFLGAELSDAVGLPRTTLL